MKKVFAAILTVLTCLGLFAGCDGESAPGEPAFAGDCGITASAEVQKNELGWLDVSLHVTNTTDKKITALRFFAVLRDKNGNELPGEAKQMFIELAESLPIPAKGTATESVILTNQYAYSFDLYVIYVAFEDGSEWGDRQPSTDEICDGAPRVPVSVIVPGVGSGS